MTAGPRHIRGILPEAMALIDANWEAAKQREREARRQEAETHDEQHQEKNHELANPDS